jgi:hypothetical protein
MRHDRYLLQIEYSSLVDVRLLKGIETCNEVGSAPAGRPVTLHKNEGNIESQKSPLVSNNTKGEERALGTMIHTDHCLLKDFVLIQGISVIQ